MKQVITELSEQLDTAAKTAQSVDMISLTNEISLEDAYDIQALSIERRLDRGEKLVGLKLGFTSKAKMEQMGVHDLIWGRLTDAMTIEDGGAMTFSKFVHPRAEPEIAFLLKEDVVGLKSMEEAIECLDCVAVAIEIIDSRYTNFKFALEDVVADNCSSAAYVIGDWHPASTKVSDLKMTLKINGEVVQSGNSNAILGNPLESLVEAIRLAHQNNVALKKGMVILAGAATPAVYLKVGDTVVANAQGLGEVSVKVV